MTEDDLTAVVEEIPHLLDLLLLHQIFQFPLLRWNLLHFIYLAYKHKTY